MRAFGLTKWRGRTRSARVSALLARAGVVALLCSSATVLACAQQVVPPPAVVEDGYDLWLRYRALPAGERLDEYREALRSMAIDTTSPTRKIAADELRRALGGLIGREPELVSGRAEPRATIVIGTPSSSPLIAGLGIAANLERAGTEGFVIDVVQLIDNRKWRLADASRRYIVIAANTNIGLLHGTFAFIRQLQTGRTLRKLYIESAPRISRRILNHWDNLDRSVERGYAGKSIWEWDALPNTVSPRIIDYARANASIGINGTVLTNVNANATVLTAPYLAKVKAIADALRPYGIRVYLTARFSAPIDIGKLATADPLDENVRRWWKEKSDEIYRAIPDFGGFLVKANSEGQPGPQDYHRTHADGANMLADAVASHQGIVIWRAFVYSNEVPVDRIRQAYDEFTPLDGKFRPNVMVQVKNGPLDFQPREPFHPLFGAMPKTPLALELQVTKEYLGQDTHLAYLAPLFKEVLDADTWRPGEGSTVARVIDGSLDHHRLSAIAGVANIGSDRNWTGSHFNQANWYAFGRLAWDYTLSAGDIADEWIRATLSHDSTVVSTVRSMMLGSREALVNYMTPLGLVHIMGRNHHYGPGPWVEGGGRADWTAVYYHRADTLGIGFDRTSTGSNAVAQYAPHVRDIFASRATVPDEYLLWFHRVGWNERMRSGRTLWNELVYRYSAGVDSARAMARAWNTVAPKVDTLRAREIGDYLEIQAKEAKWWRDAALTYFQTFSRQPFPPGVEPPAHPLDFYLQLRCPPDVTRPRCVNVY